MDNADQGGVSQPLVTEPDTITCPRCSASFSEIPGNDGATCPECAASLVTSNVVCWISYLRVCTEECAAWDDRAQENPKYSSCLVLNLARALTGHAGAIKRVVAHSSELAPGADTPPPEVL